MEPLDAILMKKKLCVFLFGGLIIPISVGLAQESGCPADDVVCLLGGTQKGATTKVEPSRKALSDATQDSLNAQGKEFQKVEEVIVDSIRETMSSPPSASSRTTNNYRCEFFCVGGGVLDTTRSGKLSILTSATDASSASDQARKSSAAVEMCAKFPYHEGGGGRAAVGSVTCTRM